jgi:predicted NBD/HSP70 family sugar kinase/mannose-6-phosphate isomerase class I
MEYFIGLDVGGSHLSGALIKKTENNFDTELISDFKINSNAPAGEIIGGFANTIKGIIKNVKSDEIEGIGISIPGPFDYKKGICKIAGLQKYGSLFGVNVRASLAAALKDVSIDPQKITFINDAEAFLMGVSETHNLYKKNITAVTIGTGFGSAGLWDGELIAGFPGKGYLYNDEFSDATAEDYFSTKWFLRKVQNGNQHPDDEILGVKELAEIAGESEKVRNIFAEFGRNLAEYFNRLFKTNQPDLLLIGGNIAKARHLFGDHFQKKFSHSTPVEWIDQTSEYAAKGAVVHHLRNDQNGNSSHEKRQSVSSVLPVHKQCNPDGYDIYPTIPLVQGEIKEGFDTFAQFLKNLNRSSIVIDGNTGIHWEDLIESIQKACAKIGLYPLFFDVSAGLKTENEIEKFLEPHLGDDDPIFGKLFDGQLIDYFDEMDISNIQPSPKNLSVLYGTGAELAGWDGPVIYFDLPKNEIQYRSRAGSICNLGKVEPENPKQMYKRYYYAEWPVCEKHKEKLLPTLTAVADAQRDNTITWAEGDDIRRSLKEVSKNPFRVRPWFEPGVWGGHWMQKHFKGLNPDAENFAWSFELIAPENGVILESKGTLMEISFEWLMHQENRNILGDDSETYGSYFPLRFDYLDTMDGGNLSLQCHPSLDYINQNFGEQITQDETYYMMKAEPGARVYLGFQDGIDPDEFETGLVEAQENGTLFDADKFVQSFTAKKHDLYLIPAGTIHCSGKDNLVLEISNTPYIYTFKMYDWQRLDLDGKPRPINIDRAMDNLDFSIQGERVQEEFISSPKEIKSGKNGCLMELPTHDKHLYRVQRAEVIDSMTMQTNKKFHLINLVEGETATISVGGHKKVLKYAESMIIPAAVGEYTIENNSEEPVKIVKAFMK